MSRKMLSVTFAASLILAGCVESDDFGGSGGFGGSGVSSDAGERLARKVCRQAIRDDGQQVVDNYRKKAVNYPYPGAGIDLYFSTRRDPMTVSLSYTRCRFMYNTGRAALSPLKRP